VVGQSNAVGPTGISDAVYAGEPVDPNLDLYINGVLTTTWDPLNGVGILPYIGEAMLNAGIANPVIVVEASSGVDMDNLIAVQQPESTAMLTTLSLDAYDAVIIIHGEADSQTEANANAYAGKLVTLYDALKVDSPGVPFWVSQVRTTYEPTYPYHATVRATQVAFDSTTGVTVIPTSDLTLHDTVHYLARPGTEGFERLAFRFAALF
jgi:hypothetical protein